MNRRHALQGMLWGTQLLALGPLAGCRGRHPASPLAGQGIRVDESFAGTISQLLERDDLGLHKKLLAHPALEAIHRHQQLSGRQHESNESLLSQIIERARRERPTSRVLDAWTGRKERLIDFANASAAYLPPEARFSGTVFLVMGYDIGVAAPPDVVLNVAHEHFQAAPSELGFYATHEAHHVGFFSRRAPPELRDLNEPERLLAIIRYITQLEGMGVHAAYPLRLAQGSVGHDHDYQVYVDASEARKVALRYRELTTKLDGRKTALSEEEVGEILTVMSSGDRIGYQFGALVASFLERTSGRARLIESIANPRLFQIAATNLLREFELVSASNRFLEVSLGGSSQARWDQPNPPTLKLSHEIAANERSAFHTLTVHQYGVQ